MLELFLVGLEKEDCGPEVHPKEGEAFERAHRSGVIGQRSMLSDLDFNGEAIEAMVVARRGEQCMLILVTGVDGRAIMYREPRIRRWWRSKHGERSMTTLVCWSVS